MRRGGSVPGVYAIPLLLIMGLVAWYAVPRLDSGGAGVLRVTRSATLARLAPDPGRFVSLVPACGCTGHTELDAFSSRRRQSALVLQLGRRNPQTWGNSTEQPSGVYGSETPYR